MFAVWFTCIIDAGFVLCPVLVEGLLGIMFDWLGAYVLRLGLSFPGLFVATSERGFRYHPLIGRTCKAFTLVGLGKCGVCCCFCWYCLLFCFSGGLVVLALLLAVLTQDFVASFAFLETSTKPKHESVTRSQATFTNFGKVARFTSRFHKCLTHIFRGLN